MQVFTRSTRAPRNAPSLASFNLRETLRPKTKLEWLLLTFGALALVWACYQTYDHITTPLAIHDNAARFAVILRDAQSYARDQATPILVEVLPARPGTASHYKQGNGRDLMRKGFFTDGVSAVGKVHFDHHGVPAIPTHIVFRKGQYKDEVIVDSKGSIFMPLR